MHRLRLLLIAVVLVASLLPAGTPVAAISPDIVISQVYGGGGNSGAPLTHDFVELFNRGTAAVAVTGWSVQYASATGTGPFANNVTALPSVAVQPGQYLLVQQAGGSNGAALPTPDATGSIFMSSTSGKVVVVRSSTGLGCNGGSSPCDAAQLSQIADLVGYGGANFFEGSAAAPGLSNTTAAIRAAGGCTDTDDNGSDFTAVAPAPRNSASPRNPCGDPGNAPIVSDCPASLTTAAGTATSAGVSATDADGTVTQAMLAVDPPAEGITLTDVVPAANTGDALTATLQVGADVGAGNYAATITFSNNDASPQTATCTVAVSVTAPPGEPTLISAVQGSGSASPLVGQTVTVEAVATALLVNNDVLDGFFLQEEDADADGDPATSEGIFVFCRGNCPTELLVGNTVTATGVVAEFGGSTQIDVTDGTVAVDPGVVALPTPATVALPAAAGTDEAATFEPVEGMLVTFPDTLAVSEYFELARFGSLVLTVDERPFQFTHAWQPSVEGYAAFLDDLATRRIILDDDNNNQNDAIEGPAADEPYYYPEGGLSVGNRFRGGDTITGLGGVMDFAFGEWRVRPSPDVYDYTFAPANPQPQSPEDVGGDLTVASFNVLNYFTTVDTTASSSSGPCGPSGTLDCRGADSDAELVRQRDKIVAALAAIDGDVVGLIEIENDNETSDAVADLVAALNAHVGAGTYAAIDTGAIGTDAIKVAFIYQLASVQPVGDFAILDSSVDPRFLDTENRPALIQTFEVIATGERFTAAVNHLKSKGSACDGDPDVGDGQGNCNLTRTAAAEALADYLATDPTGSGDPDFLILGDLNAYRNEDPITTLEQDGYTDLLEAFVGDEAYTFLFDGQLGYLDHGLANAPLAEQVTGATAWHTNADEVPLFDYNDDILDAGEASFERESNALPLYEPDAFRASDHDAVIVGLALDSPVDLAVDVADSADPVRAGDTFTYTVELENRGPGAVTDVEVDVVVGGDSRVRITDVTASPGSSYDLASGSWTVARLDEGETATLVVEVTLNRTPARPGTVTATAEIVDSSRERIALDDDRDSESTTIKPGRSPH